MHYNKTPITFEEQLEVLKKRGLIIKNEDVAIRELSLIGYFRLANYMKPMEADKRTHSFKPGSTFENAVSLYYFDKHLRALLFTAIQTIEVALRSRIMHDTAMKYGAFWFMDTSIASNTHLAEDNIKKIRKEIERSKEDFILEHTAKYTYPEVPPVWKSIEVVTFGTLSKLYTNLSDNVLKKQIARQFTIPQHKYLESWIKSFAALRNHIAHHSRIWNRNFPQLPQLPAKLTNLWIRTDNAVSSKIYPQLCCLAYLQNVIHPNNDFVKNLKVLISENPNVDLKAMGFPQDWLDNPLWCCS